MNSIPVLRQTRIQTAASDPDGKDCAGQDRNRPRVQTGDVQPGIPDHVYPVLRLQPFHLFGRRAKAGKHAAMLRDETETV